MASMSSVIPPVLLLKVWCVTLRALPDINAIFALTAVKMAATVHLHHLSTRYTPENHSYGYEWRRMQGYRPHYGRWPQHDFTTLKKLRPQSVTSRIQSGSDVIVCAEMDEQWATSALNHARAGCFMRMTGHGRPSWHTSLVSALWPRWNIFRA